MKAANKNTNNGLTTIEAAETVIEINYIKILGLFGFFNYNDPYFKLDAWVVANSTSRRFTGDITFFFNYGGDGGNVLLYIIRRSLQQKHPSFIILALLCTYKRYFDTQMMGHLHIFWNVENTSPNIYSHPLLCVLISYQPITSCYHLH